MSTSTVVSGLTGIVSDIGGVIGDIYPIALALAGSVFVALLAWKLLKRFVK